MLGKSITFIANVGHMKGNIMRASRSKPIKRIQGHHIINRTTNVILPGKNREKAIQWEPTYSFYIRYAVDPVVDHQVVMS